jgi:hypothetical protein
MGAKIVINADRLGSPPYKGGLPFLIFWINYLNGDIK